MFDNNNTENYKMKNLVDISAMVCLLYTSDAADDPSKV